MIKKVGSKWLIKSKTEKVLGEFRTEKQAQQRLAEIEQQKERKGGSK